MNSNKNNGYYIRTPIYIYGNMSLNFSEYDKCFDKIVLKIKTRFMSTKYFSLKIMPFMR